MKRIICLILALLLLTPAVLADEETMTFHMEGATGDVGDTVTIVGSVKDAPTCASFRIIMTYDDKVLEPVSCSKVDCKGLFMSNIETTYQAQPAVSALSADVSNCLSGDMELFSVSFKIIGETAADDGTLINVMHQEFFKEDLSRVYPIVEPCRIYVGSDTPGGSTTPETPDDGETDTPDSGETPEPDTSTDPEGTTPPTQETPEEDVPAATTPEEPGTTEEPEEEDKTPTGSWIVDESNDDLYHVEENGDTTVYVPEYTETPEPGKVTDVILKDKETGEEVGSLKVEGKEDGTFEVIEQDLTPPSAKEDIEGGIPGWVWPVAGGIVAIAAVGVAAAILVSRNKKSKDSDAE